jgi:Na+/H+-dicarboxylate symporter
MGNEACAICGIQFNGCLAAKIGIDIFLGLGYYMPVATIGLILLMIIYLLMVFAFTRKNPFKFLNLICEPQLLAFSTASSAAVMPLAMKQQMKTWAYPPTSVTLSSQLEPQ